MFRARRRDPGTGEAATAPVDGRAPAFPANDPAAEREERLIASAKQGELDAFNVLVSLHQQTVYAVCYRMLRDVPSAEDATQDTFVKAWGSLGSFHGASIRPWLLTIATNRCYDLIRSRSRRPADSLDAQPVEVEPTWTSQSAGAEHPEAFAARTEVSGYLERALAGLPDDQRSVVILSDIHGHSYDEIAAITGVAVGTVKSRISRGRAKLRDVLTADAQARELFARFLRQQKDESA